MMVRFLNAELSKDVQLLRSLGNFTLKAADNQLRCATDLRSCFIMSKGEPDSIQLQQLMHAAFDALLRPSNHLSGGFIACPTNQALLLRSLVDEGKYTTSKTLKSECAALQWTFQAVLVQVARLRYLHLEQYVPPDPTGTALLGPLHESGRASHATVGGEKDHVSPCPVIPSVTEGTTGMDEDCREDSDDGYGDDTAPDDIEGEQYEQSVQDIFSISDSGKRYPVKYPTFGGLIQ